MNHPAPQAPTPRQSEGVADLHVIFTAGAHRYAVVHDIVEQMVTPPPEVRVPNCHPAVRGVINLRGNVIGLVDLRIIFGARTALEEQEEILATLAERERDHHEWLTDLTDCAASGHAFQGQKDPHQCAFGRWLNTYEASSQHVKNAVSSFNGPHQRLHAAAAAVDDAVRKGDLATAQELVERARRTDMARMSSLFADMQDVLRNTRRDIALVLRLPGHSPLAVLVDSVETVDTLTAAEGADWDGLHGGGLVASIARDRESRIITVIDPNHLFGVVGA